MKPDNASGARFAPDLQKFLIETDGDPIVCIGEKAMRQAIKGIDLHDILCITEFNSAEGTARDWTSTIAEETYSEYMKDGHGTSRETVDWIENHVPFNLSPDDRCVLLGDDPAQDAHRQRADIAFSDR